MYNSNAASSDNEGSSFASSAFRAAIALRHPASSWSNSFGESGGSSSRSSAANRHQEISVTRTRSQVSGVLVCRHQVMKSLIAASPMSDTGAGRFRNRSNDRSVERRMFLVVPVKPRSSIYNKRRSTPASEGHPGHSQPRFLHQLHRILQRVENRKAVTRAHHPDSGIGRSAAEGCHRISPARIGD